MLSLRPYSETDADVWDSFCATADQATLLHTRRFLSYHGDRFVDRSLLMEESGRVMGVFPAAEHLAESSHIVSHPGATYGGIVHGGELLGQQMIEAMGLVAGHYSRLGYQRLTYKVVPNFYCVRPSNDDIYALFRLGAVRTRCDLSSTIDLSRRGVVSQRRRRSLKKARKSGVVVLEGVEYLAPLWAVLAENLASKHGVRPVHTLAEIELLASRFPDEIRCIVGLRDGQVVAGVLLFATRSCHHAQYIASSKEGYECSALDAVFEHAIEAACVEGVRWFDFGISTESNGSILNDGLYRFKSEFGGGGTVHEFYELDLTGFSESPGMAG